MAADEGLADAPAYTGGLHHDEDHNALQEGAPPAYDNGALYDAPPPAYDNGASYESSPPAYDNGVLHEGAPLAYDDGASHNEVLPMYDGGVEGEPGEMEGEVLQGEEVLPAYDAETPHSFDLVLAAGAFARFRRGH